MITAITKFQLAQLRNSCGAILADVEERTREATVGGVSIAEGMSPATFNDAMRAIMADRAKARLDQGGALTSGGSP